MAFRKRKSFKRKVYPTRRKRWYFNAGANLPIVGKTNVSFGSGFQKRSMYSIAKKVVRSTVEPKRFVHASNTNVGMTQNTVYTHNVLQQIIKGTDDVNRIGEQIYLKNIVVDISAIHNGQIGNVWYNFDKKYRFLIVKSRKEFDTDGNFTSGFGSSEILEQHTNVNHFMKSPIYKENVTVLLDRVVTVHKANTADRVINGSQKIWNVSLNMPFHYNDQSASEYGKFWNLYMILIPHIPGGTTAETMETEFNIGYHLNFGDTK